MSFFSPSQVKILLVGLPAVLAIIYLSLVFLGSKDVALMASIFVIVPMQIICGIYVVVGLSVLLLWFFGGRQRDLQDYAIIMLTFAIIFIFLLQNVPLDYWRYVRFE